MELLYIVGGVALFVGLMNRLGGKKHLFGNKIRETIHDLRS